MQRPDKSTVGGRIRYARQITGMSMKALAAGAGLSASYLQEVETGKKTLSPYLLGKIAAVLDIHPDCLANGFPGAGQWPAAPKPDPSVYEAIQAMGPDEMARFLNILSAMRDPVHGLTAAVLYSQISVVLNRDEKTMKAALLAKPGHQKEKG